MFLSVWLSALLNFHSTGTDWPAISTPGISVSAARFFQATVPFWRLESLGAVGPASNCNFVSAGSRRSVWATAIAESRDQQTTTQNWRRLFMMGMTDQPKFRLAHGDSP